MFRTRGTCSHDVGAPFMPLNAFATHRPSVKAWHGRKPIPYLPMASGIQTCYRRVCGSTTGHWGSGNAALTLSCRRCRTMPYTSSDIARFPTMLLFPRPFGARCGGRLGVICLELRPPQEAIPSVRDMAHAFTASGAAPEVLLHVYHRASVSISVASTDVHPCLIPFRQPTLTVRRGNSLRVRWVLCSPRTFVLRTPPG